ncbi:Aldehyde/histidinol dehydrogenase [Hyaloraphidium curvatum]|nr:Aldehyde/histidinol dehydrogenase [Hyaloraphidium curvatum]
MVALVRHSVVSHHRPDRPRHLHRRPRRRRLRLCQRADVRVQPAGVPAGGDAPGSFPLTGGRGPPRRRDHGRLGGAERGDNQLGPRAVFVHSARWRRRAGLLSPHRHHQRPLGNADHRRHVHPLPGLPGGLLPPDTRVGGVSVMRSDVDADARAVRRGTDLVGLGKIELLCVSNKRVVLLRRPSSLPRPAGGVRALFGRSAVVPPRQLSTTPSKPTFSATSAAMQDLQITLPATTVAILSYGALFLLVSYVARPLLLFLFPPRFPKISVEIPREASPSWDGDAALEKNAPPKGKPHSIVREGKPNMLFPFDPATGYQLPPVALTPPEELPAMVAEAREAQKEVMAMPGKGMAARMKFLGVLERWELEHGEEVAWISARGSGKTLIDAYFGEHLTNLAKLKYLRAETPRLLAPEYRSVGPMTVAKSARVDYVPFGVLGAIVSWNYPIHNVIGPVTAAIASGNACVIKVSEVGFLSPGCPGPITQPSAQYSAFTLPFLRNLFRAALQASGLPENLIRLCTGHAATGAALIPLVDKMTFIGSSGVGKAIMSKAAETLTPVVLELGGKDAAVVFDDADLGQVFNVTMRGVFQNAGQNCIGIERVLVQRGVYDKFVAEIEGRISKLRQGAPLGFGLGEDEVDVGAMVLPHSLDRIQELVDDAVKSGARLLVGGKRTVHLRWPKGQYYPPTLLVDVTPAMRIAQEEVFGPIYAIMPFTDEADAVRITNSTPFGLNGAVFTLDLAKGRRVLEATRTGMCNLNDFAVNYLCQSLPFGGVGGSGFDRFAGEEGVRGGCYARAVTEDRIPAVRNNIPPVLNYPIKGNSARFMLKLTEMMYGATWENVFGGLYGLLAALVQGGPKTAGPAKKKA